MAGEGKIRAYLGIGLRMLRIAATASLIMVMVGALAMPLVPSARAATTYVLIKDNFFDPSTVTIDIGDTVVWNQTGTNSHTVTSTTPAGELNSGTLTTGQQYSHTFNVAGTFNYRCTIHGGMTGSVVVIDASIPEFSSAPLVVLGMLVLAMFVLVTGRNR